MVSTDLRNELDARGLSARRFAHQVLGRSHTLVSFWLCGHRPIPEARVLAALDAWDRREHLRRAREAMHEASKLEPVKVEARRRSLVEEANRELHEVS